MSRRESDVTAIVVVGDAAALGGIERAAATLVGRLDALSGIEVAHLVSLRRAGARRRRGRALRLAGLFVDASVLARTVVRLARHSQGPVVLICAHIALSPVCWALARLARASLVVWVHGREVWRPNGPHICRAVQAADQVWAVSTFTAAQAPRWLGVAADRVHVVPHAWSPGFVELLRDMEPVERCPQLVLAVSRLTEVCRYKGIDVLLEAWGSVVDEVPGARLVVVGDGDDRGRLLEKARSLGVEGSVEFPGAVVDEELARWYRRAGVFALPSRFRSGAGSEGEGFGLVYLEAALAGVPSIAGRDGGAVDVVVDGETGFLVDAASPTEVADRLVRLLRDPQAARRMGEHAAAAADRFSPTAGDPVLAGLLARLHRPRPRRHPHRRPGPLLLDFSLVAPGGSSTYAHSFVAALAERPGLSGVTVLLPSDETVLVNEAVALAGAGACVVRGRAGSFGTWSARLHRQVAVARWSWALGARAVFSPQDIAPLLARGRLVVLARNVKVWRASHVDGASAWAKWFVLHVVGRMGVSRARSVLAVSGIVADCVPVAASKKHVVHHGCDLPTMASRIPATDWSGTTLSVVSVGTISTHKRFDVAIKAVACMRRAGLEVDFALWGPTEDRREHARLTALATALLGEDVLRGPVSRNRLVEILGSADVLVVGSSYESFGMTMVEAMRTRTLVVAPRSPLVDEICGADAVTYEEGSSSSAADALLGALGVAGEIVDRAAARSERFTWTRCAERTLEELRRVADE